MPSKGSRLLTRPVDWPTAATHVAGVIGDPIRHSLSPLIHNAAFAAMDLDWAYLAFPVAPGDAPSAIRGAHALGLEGLSVTMPHKTDAATAVDRLSPTAEALESVNTIVRVGSDLVGESTDGEGFLDALRIEQGFDPATRRCLVIGAGGAARAVVRALADAGAAEVVVIGRTPARLEATVALAQGVGRIGTADDAADVDLVVNATPIGMGGDGGLPLDPALLNPGQMVIDLVYHPSLTPFLVAALERGAIAANGVGMLVHQAARAFRLWTGLEAPLDVMSAVARGAILGSDMGTR